MKLFDLGPTRSRFDAIHSLSHRINLILFLYLFGIRFKLVASQLFALNCFYKQNLRPNVIVVYRFFFTSEEAWSCKLTSARSCPLWIVHSIELKNLTNFVHKNEAQQCTVQLFSQFSDNLRVSAVSDFYQHNNNILKILYIRVIISLGHL